MKKKYTNEELQFSLPDYIRGTLDDEELKVTIEDRLSHDKSFREQFEELSSTFRFLSDSRFSEPPDHYFSNLPAKINERISSAPLPSLWERLSFARKILIPVLPVILIFLVLMYSEENRETFKSLTDTGAQHKETLLTDTFTKSQPDQSASDIAFADKEEKIADNKNAQENIVKRSGRSDRSSAPRTHTEAIHTTNSEDVDFEYSTSETYDETSILMGTSESYTEPEDEFMTLSQNEQSEILEALKKY